MEDIHVYECLLTNCGDDTYAFVLGDTFKKGVPIVIACAGGNG